MKPKVYSTIYIARHGETVWNVEHRFQGQHDSPLTDKGTEQAKSLAKELLPIRFDAIFSSDLLRAKRTAEIVAGEQKLAVTTTEILREQHYGSLEGRLIHEAKEELREIFSTYESLSDREKFSFRFVEDMESDDVIASRLITYVREIAVAYEGKTVLLVCHGSLMSAFLVRLGFGKQDGIRINNTGFFVIETDGIDFFMRKMVGIRSLL